MAADASLLQARPYFLHYVFDAFTRVGRIDRFFASLQPWRNFVAQGLRTTPEHFEDGRSDCHAWSAHPAYHVMTSVLGIRPAGFGFNRVVIRPQLGELTEATGEMIHPRGTIRVQLRKRDSRLTADIDLPDGLTGTFHDGQIHRHLTSGGQSIS
jgi:alpha-L-rhamnosidase